MSITPWIQVSMARFSGMVVRARSKLSSTGNISATIIIEANFSNSPRSASVRLRRFDRSAAARCQRSCRSEARFSASSRRRRRSAISSGPLVVAFSGLAAGAGDEDSFLRHFTSKRASSLGGAGRCFFSLFGFFSHINTPASNRSLDRSYTVPERRHGDIPFWSGRRHQGIRCCRPHRRSDPARNCSLPGPNSGCRRR